MYKNLHKPTDKLLTSLSILNSKLVWNSQSKHCYFVFYPGSYPLLFPNPSSKCHTRNCKCYRDTWTSLLSYEHMCKVGCTLYYSFSELSNDIIRIFWFFPVKGYIPCQFEACLDYLKKSIWMYFYYPSSICQMRNITLLTESTSSLLLIWSTSNPPPIHF